jgi:hypothetical protein
MACATAIVKMSDSISLGDLGSSPFPEVKERAGPSVTLHRFPTLSRNNLVGLERRRCGCFPQQTPQYRDQCQRSRLTEVWGCFERPTLHMLRLPCSSHAACRDHGGLPRRYAGGTGPTKATSHKSIGARTMMKRLIIAAAVAATFGAWNLRADEAIAYTGSKVTTSKPSQDGTMSPWRISCSAMACIRPLGHRAVRRHRSDSQRSKTL